MDRIEQLTPALAGRYEIEREIGHGGMATVYLARDARHDRNVALKVLDPELAAALGADRFLAEIKTTANLQHPHVVALHDSGAVDGFLFYVMPFVEGESLRQRLDRERMLPVADAIRIAREVADALEYAHGQGIVHRDVKPENILLQRGHAMVADFGIALAVQQAGNARMTQTGLSLGTPQYMSPEQAMGERTVDARSDVYALAAITYEMLTGEPPFTGATMQAVVARILAEDPRPISTQRKAVPPSVEAAVLKALEKVPADRFASAREFSDALVADAPANLPRGKASRGWRWRETAVAALALCVVLAALLVPRLRVPRVSSAMLTSTIIAPPEAPSDLSNFALSPDGASLAFVSSAAVDGGRIWIRRMSDGSAHALAGTEGARGLFWAPDGSAIGFFAPGSLRTIEIATGSVRTLAPAPNPSLGAAWSPTGSIVYSPLFAGLWTVAANGGTPKQLTAGAEGRTPSFLPDGHRFLYWVPGDNGKPAATFVGDVATGEVRRIADGISHPRYFAPGYLLFFQESDRTVLEQPAALFAQQFDLSRLVLTGQPVALSRGVDRPFQFAAVSATPDLLLMREPRIPPDPRAKESIYWLDRATGRTTPITGAGTTWTFRISHDGHRVMFGGEGLWLYDPDRDVSIRVPTKAQAPWPPVWSHDDRSIVVVDAENLAQIPLGGESSERTLKASSDAGWADPVDAAPDGSAIFYVREPSALRPQWELWRYMTATGTNEHVPTGPGNPMDARVSPDSKWIAWESDATGRHEIYLGPISGTTTPLRVSKAGGGSPRWRADGRELYFIGGDGRIASVSVELKSAPVVGEPRSVSKVVINPEPFGTDPLLHTRFDVTPKGDRFLIQTPPDVGIYQLTLVQRWQDRMAR